VAHIIKTTAGILGLLILPAGVSAQVASPRAQDDALRHYRAGQELMYREAFDRAAAEFRRAVRFDPLLTLAHYGLGQASMELGEYADAIAAFSGCRDAYRRIGELSVRQAVNADRLRDDEIRELREAVRAIRSGRVAAEQPGNAVLRLESRIRDLERTRQRGHEGVLVPAEVFFSLGSAYFRAGRLPDAEREWTAAVERNGRFGEAWNNLAALYLMTGRPARAGDAVAQAERADFPVHPQLKTDIQKANGGR
jgi:tetratricopeptide (TPR) repeat protein